MTHLPRLTSLKLIAPALSVCALMIGQIAHAAKPTAPFVAGFDRFGSHGEISPQTAGQLLLTELSCTACHRTNQPQLEPKRGPNLDGAATRLTSDWIEKFLSAPHSVKPGTTMPDLLAGLPQGERKSAASALTAFLGTLRKPFPTIKAGGVNPVPFEFWTKGNPQHGRQLYHQIGCIACHDPDPEYEVAAIKPSPFDELLNQLDAEDLKEMGLTGAARRVNSVPHGDLNDKYTVKSLTFFLLNPAAVRPGGRMPNLKLGAVEAADLAAYLLRNQTPQKNSPSQAASRQLVEQGRRLFTELRCAQCHSVHGIKANKPARPLSELTASANGSCLSNPRPSEPHYDLDKPQISALQAALKEFAKPEGSDIAANLQLHMLKLNCYACHERDKLGGVGRFRKPYFETRGHVDIGDEGRLAPPLTGVGKKLNAGWLGKVFKGDGEVRPFMHLRMPKYPPPLVKDLPAQLAQADGLTKRSEKAVFGDRAKLATAGRQLLNVGCVECHQVRGESLPGTVGIDLKGVTERVHPQWFHDFLLNPAELKTRTRMPTFFPGGKSQNQDVLHGDTDRQIAALWTYLREIDKQPLPEKIEQARAQDYELRPKERPIVLRTFMKRAGTHAIAIGFPQQVHLAFDAEKVRWAIAWQGRFLDARGTWFERFAPPADPLGEQLIVLPTAVPFAKLKDAQQAWPAGSADPIGYKFAGYRLDPTGVPTLLYRFGDFDIEDRVDPSGKQTFERQLKIRRQNDKAGAAAIWFMANQGKTLKQNADNTTVNDKGLVVLLPESLAKDSQLRKSKQTSEWIVPLNVGDETTFKVKYSW